MARNLNDVKGGGTGGDMTAPSLNPQAYPARLVGITFCGVQPQRPFKGEEKAPIDEVRYTYELSHEFMLDKEGEELEDKPRFFSEEMPVYGPSADRAKLTRRNLAIDPSSTVYGVARDMLGFPCSVFITRKDGTGKHVGKVFNNVGDVSPLGQMKGYTQPELVNEPMYFDLHDEDCTLDDFRRLPEFVQTKIKGALDYEGSHLCNLLANAPVEEKEQGDKPAEQGDAPVEQGPDLGNDDINEDDIPY